MNQPAFVDKSTAIRQMNELASQKKPFLFVISYKADQVMIQQEHEIDPELVLFSIKGFTNYQEKLPVKSPFIFRKNPVDPSVYRKQFERVMCEIGYGNSYLLNLTCPTAISTDLSLRDIFSLSDANYKLWLHGLFVVFSPETFITVNDGWISSFPMKGTIDASVPNAEKILLGDAKELAEHYTIVDLIRNDLNRVAKKVHVERFRYLEKIETNYGSLLQASSKITGRLPEKYTDQIGDILFSLLPAGSITGAPKEKTVEIIKNTEEYDRGFYTGIFGWFDGSNLESAVMIRFIEQTKGGLVFKSGGGITSKSQEEQEYREMINKVYVPFT